MKSEYNQDIFATCFTDKRRIFALEVYMIVYNDIDIVSDIDGCVFHALNIISARIDGTMPFHAHGAGCYELHFIPSGKGVLLTDDRKYDIQPGTLYITGPNVNHAQIPDKDEPMWEYCIYLKTESKLGVKHLMENLINQPFAFYSDCDRMKENFDKLFNELSERRSGFSVVCSALLTEILVEIVRINADLSKQYPKEIISANEKSTLIVEEYFLYCYRNATLTELAGKMNLSIRQTQRFLSQKYGRTFQEFKAESRMSSAKMLLLNSNHTISDIAEFVGYSSSEHFCAAFRKQCGITPGEYRKTRSTAVLNRHAFYE